MYELPFRGRKKLLKTGFYQEKLCIVCEHKKLANARFEYDVRSIESNKQGQKASAE